MRFNGGGIALALALVSALGACVLAGCARAERPQDTSDQLIYSDPDDPSLKSALAEARRTLPIFWSKFDAKAPGYDGFALKVAMPTSGGGVEHIWMEVIGRTDREIVGRLANEPVEIEGLALGSQVRVDPRNISDWTYEKDGKGYGHYTTRALMSRANAQQRAEAQAYFASLPLESEAR